MIGGLLACLVLAPGCTSANTGAQATLDGKTVTTSGLGDQRMNVQFKQVIEKDGETEVLDGGAIQASGPDSLDYINVGQFFDSLSSYPEATVVLTNDGHLVANDTGTVKAKRIELEFVDGRKTLIEDFERSMSDQILAQTQLRQALVEWWNQLSADQREQFTEYMNTGNKWADVFGAYADVAKSVLLGVPTTTPPPLGGDGGDTDGG